MERFEGNRRLHVGLATKDLDASVDFYRTLFGVEPTKLLPDYAKFEVTEPMVNLSLNPTRGEISLPKNMHFGVEMKSVEAVTNAKARLEIAGLATKTEDDITCCYARADKVWAEDPDGHPWEIYVVHEDAQVHSVKETAERDCCAPDCCT